MAVSTLRILGILSATGWLILPFLSGQALGAEPARTGPFRGLARHSPPPLPPTPSADTTLDVSGTWTDSYTYQWVISQSGTSVSGTVANLGCGVWTVSGAVTGSATFTFRATNPTGGNDDCAAWFEYSLSMTGTDSASGSWNNSGGNTGTVSMTREPRETALVLTRDSLTQLTGSGTPQPGTFSIKRTPGIGAATLGFAAGSTADSNPARLELKMTSSDQSIGEPQPGGLGSYEVKYTLKSSADQSDAQSFKAATFGMSCYYTILESDWGTAPDKCKKTTINGKKYKGYSENEYGLKGLYCNSFIQQTILQGSAVLTDGTPVQYVGGKIKKVKSIKTADGKIPIVDGTVARDRKVIKGRGVLIDVDGVGKGLRADDIGEDIKGYRLDLYRGAGVGVCRRYNNTVAVSSCAPELDKCPGLQP